MTARQPAPHPLPDGVLVVDKPARLSSYDVIRHLKPLLGKTKAGFVGTLDPFATGVLPLCIGEGTKLADALGDGEKVYVATLALGTATDTGDLTGREFRRASVPAFTPDDLARAAAAFTGTLQQVPPMYSAIHVAGERLYEKARRGEVVERSPRTVMVHALELVLASPDTIELTVRCSKGTYVRVLGEDLARALGTEGHLSALRRARGGSFSSARAGTLEAILASPLDAFVRFGLTLDEISLPGFARLEIDEPGVRSVLNGGPVRLANLVGNSDTPAPGARVALYFAQHLTALATGADDMDVIARPTRLLVRSDLGL